MSDVKLVHGDCLEVMKTMPEKSVDLIVADVPYNTKKAAWDNIPGYLEWMGSVFLSCQKRLKDNGSFYWFHSELDIISQLMEWLRVNTNFIFKSFIVWDKGEFRALSWKKPTLDNNLRSWFNVCEYILFYTFQENTGLEIIDKEYVAPRNPFRRELRSAMDKAKLGATEVAKKGHFYGAINHGGAVTNWLKGYNIPLQEQWELLKTFLPICREYEDLRHEYEDLRHEYEGLRYTHNLDRKHNNVWGAKYRNKGEKHLAEKPIDIISRIILCSSNEGDLILDPFMGSGTTGVACHNLNRKFIGIELDAKYFAIAKKRIEGVQRQQRLFIPIPKPKLEQLTL